MDLLAKVDESFLETIEGEKGGMVLTTPEAIGEIVARLDEPVEQVAGGSAGNTTFAAARAGLRCTFLGKVGDDATGALYQEQFRRLGGDDSRFKLGLVATGTCLSLITPDSERTMRTDLGAAATLAPEDITVRDFNGCRHAHIEGYLLFNEALFRRVLECAKDAGCTISLDLASFEVVGAAKEILPELLTEYVDLLIANEDEAAAMLDKPAEAPLDEMAMALNQYASLVVVKGGANGCYISQEGKCIHVPGVPGVIPVDTTGAGDVWAAGFLHGWLSGDPLKTCGERGNAFGAAVVQRIGAKLEEDAWENLGFPA